MPDAAAAVAAPAVVAAPPPAAAVPAVVVAPPSPAPVAAAPLPPAEVAPAAPAVVAAPAVQPPAPVATPEAAKLATPPAAAEIELKVPEGAKFDPAALDAFKSIVKQEGVTGKQAQALVDFQAAQNAAQAKAFNEHVQRQRVADLDELKGDKDFGGARYDQTVAGAKSAARQFGGEGLSKLLEASGLDCHPDVVKTFARIRAAIAEDSTAGRLRSAPAGEVKAPPRTMQERFAARYAKPAK